MTIQDADSFPLGVSIFDGLYVIESPIRGYPERGQYRARPAEDDEESHVIVTMTTRQGPSFQELEDRLAITADGVATLRGFHELEHPLGGIYTSMMEEEPPGRPISELRLPLAVPAAARVARGICDALEDAHGYGWVLGTMRPELVYVEGDGGELLMTEVAPRCERFFATAIPTDAPTPPIFDRLYQAPELLAGREPTAATDVFSLTAMLAEWLTGRHPFEGDGAQSQLFAITAGRRRPWQGPPAQRDLVERGLAANPADRPSLHELREALESLR
jgi:serine/threonine protein kinase